MDWRLVCHDCGWLGPVNGAARHKCDGGDSHSLHIHDIGKPCKRCDKQAEHTYATEHEPKPTKPAGEVPAAWDLVFADMQARDKIGEERYGTRLYPFNGRKTLVDIYQELLDALVYVRSAIYEQEGK